MTERVPPQPGYESLLSPSEPMAAPSPQPPSTTTTKLQIVALESQFGPIPDFDICNGGYEITVYHQTPRNSPAILNERLRDADVAIITTMPMTAATLAPDVTPRLRAIMVMAAGTDHLDLDCCRRRGIRVLNSPRANTETVAEHAIALYFSIRRNIVQTHQQAVRDGWFKHQTLLSSLRDGQGGLPVGLKDEMVGIIGYGGVGKHIAKLCTALGTTVRISDRKLPAASLHNHTGSSSLARSTFADILTQSTVIFICVPRNPTTMDMISASEIALMRPQALLINVSRGGIVNELDLLRALQNRRIAGAATDVFVDEPAWTENSVLVKALATEENEGEHVTLLPLVLTPHTAWYSQATMDNLTQSVKANVEGWCRGSCPPENVVV